MMKLVPWPSAELYDIYIYMPLDFVYICQMKHFMYSSISCNNTVFT